MNVRSLSAGIAALLLGACGEPPPSPTADNPLLWEIANAEGQVEGWLYGTIHALPDGIAWQRGTVDEVIEAADYLVLEVAELENRGAIRQSFAALAQSPGHPPLELRVDAARREALAELVDETPYTARQYRQIETWGAALILAQAIRTDADPANGVDRALQRLFADRRVEEFEGAERQFMIFDRLAEADQRAMLAAVVDDARNADGAPEPADLWLSGDVRALEAETERGILADPEIRDALLIGRNRSWADRAADLLRQAPRPLIAVGAAHLVGPEGLVALLEAKGYTLRRIR